MVTSVSALTSLDWFDADPAAMFRVNSIYSIDSRVDACAGHVTQPFKRALGPFDATMIVIGGIIGSGIFINPYIVAQRLEFVGAGDRRVGRRRGDRADRRAGVRGARRDVADRGRAVCLSARCLSPARRVPVRLGAAVHDRERRDGGGGDDVCGIRGAARLRSAAGLGADRRRRRARGRDRRDRVPVDHQLPRRHSRQPAAQRLRRVEGRGARGADRRRAVVQRRAWLGAACGGRGIAGIARGVRRGADSDRVRLRRLAERQLRGRGDQGSEAHPADLPAGSARRSSRWSTSRSTSRI